MNDLFSNLKQTGRIGNGVVARPKSSMKNSNIQSVGKQPHFQKRSINKRVKIGLVCFPFETMTF